MALVLMATHPWGTLWDPSGNVQPGEQASFTNIDDATAVTHYADADASSPSTGPVTADADGRLMRWVAEDSYNMELPDATVLQVEATSGRTLRDVAAQVVNVKSAPYNAVGDGVADDAAALAAAITAAGVGGTVIFPAATYKHTVKLLPLRDQTWVGAGNQSYAETTGGTRLLYSGSDFALLTPIRNLKVSRMKIECSGTALGCVEIADPSLHNTFEHVTFKGYDTTTPTGVRFSGQVACSCFNTFRDCTFHTLKRAQRLSGFANANLFEQCVTFNCDIGADLSVIGSDTLAGQDNVFLRCEWDGAVVTQAINLSNTAERNLFIKCCCDGTTASANINAHRNVFTGCVLNPAPTYGGGIQATTTILDSQQGSGTGRVNQFNGEVTTTARITSADGFAQSNGALQLLSLVNDTGVEFYTVSGAAGNTRMRIGASGYLEQYEQTAPAAGAADTARLFTRDNGSGKTQVCVIFNTGAIQVIATQP